MNSKDYIKVKQRAIVIDEVLTGNYPYRHIGRIRVKLYSTGKTYWISTYNFSKVEYWKCSPEIAIKTGCALAITSSSPIGSDGKWVNFGGAYYVLLTKGTNFSGEVTNLYDKNYYCFYSEVLSLNLNELKIVY